MIDDYMFIGSKLTLHKEYLTDEFAIYIVVNANGEIETYINEVKM